MICTNPIETIFFSIASSLYGIIFIAYLHHHRFRRPRTNIIWTISILSPISNFFWRGFIYAEFWHYLKHHISQRLSVPLKRIRILCFTFFSIFKRCLSRLSYLQIAKGFFFLLHCFQSLNLVG